MLKYINLNLKTCKVIKLMNNKDSDSDNIFIENFNNKESNNKESLILSNSTENKTINYIKNETFSEENSKITSSKKSLFDKPCIEYESVSIKKPNNMSIIPNEVTKEMLNVTSSIDFIDNDIPEFISEKNSKGIKINKLKKIKKKKIFKKKSIKNKLNHNGWDNDTTNTITKWFMIFKKYSFIYQLVLDNNKSVANKLGITSIIFSSMLGIFSGFKLWVDNKSFEVYSNIVLMLLNFIVAFITAISKQYIDNNRNDIIKKYIEEVDIFRVEISAELLKPIAYRMHADDFLKLNNDKYTKLISLAPNLSLTEFKKGKKKYKNYLKHNDDQV